MPDVLSFGLALFLGIHYKILNNTLFIGTLVALFLIWLRQFLVIRANEQLLIMVRKNRKELKRQNDELRRRNSIASKDASIDFLTGLYNRRHIDRVLKRPKESDDGEIRVGILLIDVDFFKKVNDTLGHTEGDKVLQRVAAAIASTAADRDIGGRYGGDEFILILYDVNEELASMSALLLQEQIWSDEYLSKIPVTLSIGCTVWEGSIKDYDADALVKRADEALYQSKQNGRDQYNVLPMNDAIQ